MSDEKPRFDLGLNQDQDALWERVREIYREQGEDLDEVLARAAENMNRWRAERDALSEEQRQALYAEEARAWAEHEATLDDAGNPLKPKP